ncbi:hypothetical protein CEXT_428551 [Caerostris extrusa]|uniref:Uncharacterized protein n=1 Tax=Caerostris extrusa TaxID=172846 RepID=A0AAV4R9A6_CAEEX|nr:hypothetical protein CEXT_428551 [Caerostris extrusa]
MDLQSKTSDIQVQVNCRKLRTTQLPKFPVKNEEESITERWSNTSRIRTCVHKRESDFHAFINEHLRAGRMAFKFNSITEHIRTNQLQKTPMKNIWAYG